jgi:hypothetical protein
MLDQVSAMQMAKGSVKESLVTVSAKFEFKTIGAGAKEQMGCVEEDCQGPSEVVKKRALITHISVADGALSECQS